jgi:hypothetical protein
MLTHSRWTSIALVGVLVAGAALLAVAVGRPSTAFAQSPFKETKVHKRIQMRPPTIPGYTFGEPYEVPGQPGQYVTLTTADGKTYVIPAPPYDHGGTWGSFQSYDVWNTQFRSQNRGNAPTLKDEIDFWLSQAVAGVTNVAPQTVLPAGISAPAGYVASRGSSGLAIGPTIDYSGFATPQLVASYIPPFVPDLNTSNPYAVIFRSFLGTDIPIWRDLAATMNLPAHFPQSLADIPGN